MPPKASQKWSPWNYIIYILVGITTFFQKPKKPTQATWQATTKTEMSQRHYTAIKPSQNPQPLAWYVHLLACGLLALPSLNHTLKDLPIPPPPPQLETGDNASCSTFFACSLLALPSLTHTLKDLPLPPMGSKEWRITYYPFCMWSFGPISNSLTHTLKDLPVSCKVGPSNLIRCHKDGVITHHKDVVTKTG